MRSGLRLGRGGHGILPVWLFCVSVLGLPVPLAAQDAVAVGQEEKAAVGVAPAATSVPPAATTEAGPQPAAEPQIAPPEASLRPAGPLMAEEDNASTAGMRAEDLQDDEVDQAKAYPRFEGRLRVITGANYRSTHPGDGQFEEDTKQPFFLKQARIKVAAKLNKWVRLSMSGDLESKPAVRTAFANVRIKKYLQFKVGRFKRPISRLELTSVGDLPFIDRGLFNAALLEDGGWGDRALGVMVHGKIKKLDLSYSVAGMNAAPTVDFSFDERLRGGDLLARVQWSPGRWLRLGLNGGHKVVEARVNGPNHQLNAIGGDVRLRFGPLTWNVETTFAQNPRPPAPPTVQDRTPWAADAVTYGQLDFSLSQELALQPTFFFEWTDTDLDVSQDEAIRGLLGVNLLAFEVLRIMPYVEVVRPLGTVGARSQLSYENYALAVSLQI